MKNSRKKNSISKKRFKIVVNNRSYNDDNDDHCNYDSATNHARIHNNEVNCQYQILFPLCCM